MEQQGYQGIFSLFITDRPDHAETMTQDIRLPLISFTGSVPIGRQVASIVARRLGRTLLELSGNNAVIVDETADLDLPFAPLCSAPWERPASAAPRLGDSLSKSRSMTTW